MPGLGSEMPNKNDSTNESQTTHYMTLDAVNIVHLIPSSVGASPIPISIASRRSSLKSDVLLLKEESMSTVSNPEMKSEYEDKHEHELQPYLQVGRQSTSSDIRIQHNSISRKHALLYYDEDGNCVVQDLGSKYGTTINQHRISSRTFILQHDDTIQFGNVRDYVFTVQITGQTDRRSNNGTKSTIDIPQTTTIKRTNIEGDSVVGMMMNDETERRSNTSIPALALQSQQQQQQQQQQPLTDLIEKAGEGLSGRAKHQAEIAAMMSTLDEIPTYTKVTIPEDIPTENAAHTVTTTTYTIADTYQIPISNHIVLESDQARKNVPTCLSIDPVGARFMMGSTDTTLRMYDFGGLMTSSTSLSNRQVVHASSFKSIIPEDGYWPVSCTYSNTGDRIMVGTGSVQPMVTDRDGETIIKFVRGDMYVTDQSKTFGHTAAVTGVAWHPFERDVVVTSSIDGSARLWNIHSGKKQFQMLVCDKVFQPKSSQGKRTTVLCIAYHPSGREFAVGTSCGSIQIWNPTRASARPERALYAAHGNHSMRVTSLTYNYDGSKIATRSADSNTTKVWNATKMSSSSVALVTCNDTNTIYEQANVAFSPDGKLLCVGVATVIDDPDHNKKRHETGGLQFYDISIDQPSCDPILTLNMNESNVGVVLVAWHAKINQIVVACSNGQIIVYFNPSTSQKGAIGASRKVRKSVDGLTELLRSRAPTGSAAITGEIITPLYNPNLGHKRKRNEIVEETHTLEPERPVASKHKIGSGGSSGLSFQQYVADTDIGSTSKIIAGNDPREALFKYNEGKAFVDRAYEGNKSKLAEKTAEQEDEESKKKRDFFNSS